MRARVALPAAAGAALALSLAFGLLPVPGEAPQPDPVGQAAPVFVLPNLHRPQQHLGSADMRGQVWLLNIWASWCAACREEHPLLRGWSQQARVPILGLNYRDDPRDAQEWLRRLGDPYAVVASDSDGRVGSSYGVQGVPQTLVIDKAGVVRLRHVGPLTQEVWLRDMQPLIQRLQG